MAGAPITVGDDDNVRVWLHPGEYILTAAACRRLFGDAGWIIPPPGDDAPEDDR
jgi:hypothetical protein